MDTTEVILIAAALLALGFSLYRRYAKKDQGKSNYGQKEKPGSSFSSYSKDDDYEPYSKK
jgi:hypothetical protein